MQEKRTRNYAVAMMARHRTQALTARYFGISPSRVQQVVRDENRRLVQQHADDLRRLEWQHTKALLGV